MGYVGSAVHFILWFFRATCQTIAFAIASARALLYVVMEESVFCDVITSFSQITQC